MWVLFVYMYIYIYIYVGIRIRALESRALGLGFRVSGLWCGGLYGPMEILFIDLELHGKFNTRILGTRESKTWSTQLS